MTGSRPKKSIQNWAELPIELLCLILKNLTLLDYIRFNSVCKSWNLAFKQKAHHPKPRPPWLMLRGHNDTTARFYSISEKRTYSIPLPLPLGSGRICLGSCFGWLITIDRVSEMHILNPVTGVQLQLPSITTIPRLQNRSCYQRFYFFIKAILSSAPCSDGSGNFTIILINLDFRLVFARIGDMSWTEVTEPLRIRDIIHHNGRLHGLEATEGTVHVWDHNRFLSDSITSAEPQLNTMWYKYLAKSVEGELFMLCRGRNGPGSGTAKFELFRLDMEGHGSNIAQDVKDDVFFVGNNCSMSVSAAEFPELRRNCIYFTDELFQSPHQLSLCEAGVFDVADRSVTLFVDIDSHLKWPPPIWITPTLF